MNIYAQNGDKVIFNKPTNGYDGDKKIAAKYLGVGQIYTVDYTEVGGYHTSVYLKEIPNIGFNSVLFSDYTEKPEQKLWKTLGRADAWFYVMANSEEEALEKAAVGKYEKVEFEDAEPYCEEAFEVENEDE